MENAVQALKMAAAALVFIIAIGISFYMFGISKNTADSIIGMRDKQSYLEAAELDGTLYTTSSVTQKEDGTLEGSGTVTSVTKNGDRIVGIDDVISTLYRYKKENYAVTIMENDGDIIARFDLNTESIMEHGGWSEEDFKKIETDLTNRLKNAYNVVPNFSGTNSLKKLYEIIGRNSYNYGAPWGGNDEEIQKRVNADIYGQTYINNSNGQKYKGKGILSSLKNAINIVEVLNEIDQSEYILYDHDESESTPNINTGLLKEYQMPTVEIIYILDPSGI